MEGQEGFFLKSGWDLGRLIYIQMAVKAAIELNVFDIIASSGPQSHLSSSEIVSKIPNANPNAATTLDRILRMLGASSILSMHFDRQETTYGLKEEFRSLARNNGDGVSSSSMVLFSAQREVAECLSILKDSVLKPGCLPLYDTYHGVSWFEDASRKPGFSRSFNEAMMAHSMLVVGKVLELYGGFKDVSELMDVGGGIGTTIQKIVSIHPHIRGINFDLPHVIVDAPNYPGVEHVAGDMFEPLPNAQSILLKHILHDWNDDRCIALLKNCWKALPSEGKVMVMECVIPQVLLQNDIESINATTSDFAVMVFHGGRERTAPEFEYLATTAGFSQMNIFSIFQELHVLEFIKC